MAILGKLVAVVTADTSKFVEKLIVPAVPTVEPSCLTIIPVPDAVTPVIFDPSP